MMRHVSTFLMMAMAACAVSCTASSRPYTSKSLPYALGKGGKGLAVRTTAYSDKENEAGGKYGNRNAIGLPLRYGRVRSAAADWSRFPLGTKFRIAGDKSLYVIDDYGRALVGTNTIDIYKPTLGSMREWGVRNVRIEIVQWGSFAQSLRVLAPRTKYEHCRQMARDISRRARI